VAMYLRSRRQPVDHRNVNDDWDAATADTAAPAHAA
jgi:hypothetical protein